MIAPIVAGHYDPVLVALSLAVSLVGSYTALDLAERAHSSARFGTRFGTICLIGSAVAMAAGIWTMHFVGMLAFSLDIPVSYDPATTALSLAAPMLLTGAALSAVTYLPARMPALTAAGLLMGLSIVLMHYLGLSGMRMAARIDYAPPLVALSAAIAVAASTGALWLSAHARREGVKMLGAAVMGLAVAAMHYIGMSAADFVMTGPAVPPPDPVTQPHLLAMAVTLATFIILLLAQLSSLSDRRLAAEQRAEQEAAYHALVDSAADAILVLDEDGLIRSFNRAAEGVFGYDAAWAVGRPVSLLIPRPGQGRRRDGSLFPMELSTAEWTAGSRRYVTNILRDVTERVRAETELRAAKDEAERAVRAKAKFLAAASHDLRQPVQSLFFFASALGMRLENHPAEPVVANMNESLAALKMLLDGLLDISRLDAGVIEAKVAPFAMDGLLQRLGGEYGPRAAEQGLDLRVVASRAWTRSDPALLERILRNLIENALRYTARGKILIGCRPVGNRLRLEVWDTGIGIPDDKIGELFEEFYQVGNPERDRRQGLGLGLAIVRRLADMLGHRVTVRSRDGRGSVFAVDLPRLRAGPAPRPQSAGSIANDDGQGLVVVIEDEQILLLSMRALLESWGHEVVAAPSGAEALKLLDGMTRPPDTIIADYRLRDGLTGPQAIHDIRDLYGPRIPAIVLTGDTAPERMAEAARSGFTILHKPVSPPELKRLLNQSLAAPEEHRRRRTAAGT